MQLTGNPAEGFLKLGGNLLINDVQELHKALVTALAAPGDLTLDMSEVTSCDTASLQLLCSARRSVIQEKKQLRLKAISGAVTEAVAALGLTFEEFLTETNVVAQDAATNLNPGKRGTQVAE
jgi:anti-anti-sigma factor